jgi:hypothetical protein
MRSRLLSVCLLTTSCASVAPFAAPQNPTPEPHLSKIDVYVGVRDLRGNEWDPVQDQGVIGLEYVHEDPTDAMGFELGLFGSRKTKGDVQIGGSLFDVRGQTSEFSAGVRKTFWTESGSIYPYVGLGISAIRAQIRRESGGVTSDDADSTAGLYAHGGFALALGPSLTLGLDLRVLGGTKVQLFGQNGNADYAQLALVLGARF